MFVLCKFESIRKVRVFFALNQDLALVEVAEACFLVQCKVQSMALLRSILLIATNGSHFILQYPLVILRELDWAKAIPDLSCFEFFIKIPRKPLK